MRLLHEAPKKRALPGEHPIVDHGSRRPGPVWKTPTREFRHPVDRAHMPTRQPTPQRGARNYARVPVLSRREPMREVRPVPRMTAPEARVRVRERNIAARESELAYREGLMASQQGAYYYPQEPVKKKKTRKERLQHWNEIIMGDWAHNTK